MSFLVILCEGYTEMHFVRDVLAAHLLDHGVKVHQMLFGQTVKHDIADSLGGVLKYEPVYKYIQANLRRYSSSTCHVTTLLDFYAFPRDFPDYATHASIVDPYERVASFENAMRYQINNDRFIPNIQLHEFETLVLAKPDAILDEFPDKRPDAGLLELLRDIGDLRPEEINQTKEGAPSKRIGRFIPDYKKSTMGPSITRRIGWQRLKETCPHFGAWLSALEALG